LAHLRSFEPWFAGVGWEVTGDLIHFVAQMCYNAKRSAENVQLKNLKFKLVIVWIVIKESFDLILNLTVPDLTILQYLIRRGGRRIACFYFLDFH